MKCPMIKRVVAVLFVSAVALSAQESKAQEALTSNPVYQKNCAKCHGKTAEGRFMAGPSLVSEKVTATSADELRQVITSGKHRMPKFEGKLSAAEIDALVDQIRSQKKSR